MAAGTLRYTLVVRHPETGEAAALLEGEPVPDWASDLVHEDDLEGGTGDDDDTPSYSSMKKADLEAEVAKRNEGRDEGDVIEVEGKGTVADLVAALEADDQAQADAGA